MKIHTILPSEVVERSLTGENAVDRVVAVDRGAYRIKKYHAQQESYEVELISPLEPESRRRPPGPAGESPNGEGPPGPS